MSSICASSSDCSDAVWTILAALGSTDVAAFRGSTHEVMLTPKSMQIASSNIWRGWPQNSKLLSQGVTKVARLSVELVYDDRWNCTDTSGKCLGLGSRFPRARSRRVGSAACCR